MKTFEITQVLLYNPTLKSHKKKPIESDIQQAKIMAYFPPDVPIEQKCNTVGMAEGVFEFSRSLLTETQRQNNARHLSITMDNCTLVSKEVEDNIWVFIKMEYHQAESEYQRMGQNEQNTYIDNIITEQMSLDVLQHFYLSFKTFYGKISGYLFLKKEHELQKTLEYFLGVYHQLNKLEQNRKIDITSYLFPNIRSLPLDVNTVLKFGYFKNVMKSYDANISDIVIFSHGLLAYSTLPKQITQFFAHYFYGTGQPYKFDVRQLQKRFRIISDLEVLNVQEKYGSIFNSYNFGFGENYKMADSRASIAGSKIKQESQDLLGVEQSSRLSFPEVFIDKDGEEFSFQMSCFLQKSMLFLTFYSAINEKDQIIFQNRFYHDNIDKFMPKIELVLNKIVSQFDNYKFLYCNRSTYHGKLSFERWALIVPELRFILPALQENEQGIVATTYQNHWVYGVNRLNRLLILLIPNDIPLQKLDEFASKMFREHFFKAYM